jgi:ribosomal protein S18 acetylase RimI-like enzyme
MASQPQSRISRSKIHAKGVAEGKLVETVNSLQFDDFWNTYGQDGGEERMTDGFSLVLEFIRGDVEVLERRKNEDILEKCFKLIEETSADDYRNSEIKWSASQKRKEMRLPDMKYLVYRHRETGQVIGFTSFMVTYEDGYEVVYVYEIHLLQDWQGKGLGKRLMSIVDIISSKVGVGKIMLTVFKANTKAIQWYDKLGYTEDTFSPQPRKLRNGTIKEPTYTILSKKPESRHFMT